MDGAGNNSASGPFSFAQESHNEYNNRRTSTDRSTKVAEASRNSWILVFPRKRNFVDGRTAGVFFPDVIPGMACLIEPLDG